MGVGTHPPGKPRLSRYRQAAAFCLVVLALGLLTGIGYLSGANATGSFVYGYQYCTTPSQYQYCSTSTSTTTTASTTTTSTSSSTGSTTIGSTSTTTVATTTTTATTTTSTTTRSTHRQPKCRVPHVVGKKKEKAATAIRHAHCTVGKVRWRWSRRFTRGKVISQRPSARTILAHGGRVNLVVSVGKCHDDHDKDRDDLCPPFGAPGRGESGSP